MSEAKVSTRRRREHFFHAHGWAARFERTLIPGEAVLVLPSTFELENSQQKFKQDGVTYLDAVAMQAFWTRVVAEWDDL